MLINCDFERHGFEFYKQTCDTEKWYTIHPECAFDIMINKLRKGMSKITLYNNGTYIASEVMWHPTQLRDFLLFHKVIMP